MTLSENQLDTGKIPRFLGSSVSAQEALILLFWACLLAVPHRKAFLHKITTILPKPDQCPFVALDIYVHHLSIGLRLKPSYLNWLYLCPENPIIISSLFIKLAVRMVSVEGHCTMVKLTCLPSLGNDIGWANPIPRDSSFLNSLKQYRRISQKGFLS